MMRAALSGLLSLAVVTMMVDSARHTASRVVLSLGPVLALLFGACVWALYRWGGTWEPSRSRVALRWVVPIAVVGGISLQTTYPSATSYLALTGMSGALITGAVVRFSQGQR